MIEKNRVKDQVANAEDDVLNADVSIVHYLLLSRNRASDADQRSTKHRVMIRNNASRVRDHCLIAPVDTFPMKRASVMLLIEQLVVAAVENDVNAMMMRGKNWM